MQDRRHTAAHDPATPFASCDRSLTAVAPAQVTGCVIVPSVPTGCVGGDVCAPAGRAAVALLLVAVGQSATAGPATGWRGAGGRTAMGWAGSSWPGRVGGLSGTPTRLATAVPRWLALVSEAWARCGPPEAAVSTWWASGTGGAAAIRGKYDEVTCGLRRR